MDKQQFFQTYKKWILVLVAATLLLVVFLSVNYFLKANQQKQAQAFSQALLQTTQSSPTIDLEPFSGNYAPLAKVLQAKQFFNNQQYDLAENLLLEVLQQEADQLGYLVHAVRYFLAQTYNQNQKHSEAIALLNGFFDNAGFEILYAVGLAETYIAQNDFNQARTQYQQAREIAQTQNNNQLIQWVEQQINLLP